MSKKIMELQPLVVEYCSLHREVRVQEVFNYLIRIGEGTRHASVAILVRKHMQEQAAVEYETNKWRWTGNAPADKSTYNASAYAFLDTVKCNPCDDVYKILKSTKPVDVEAAILALCDEHKISVATFVEYIKQKKNEGRTAITKVA